MVEKEVNERIKIDFEEGLIALIIEALESSPGLFRALKLAVERVERGKIAIDLSRDITPPVNESSSVRN
jgi:hypothetical protein